MSYDKAIMEKLLKEPGVRENVAKMTQKERALFKKLLVEQSIYAQYVKELEEKAQQ